MASQESRRSPKTAFPDRPWESSVIYVLGIGLAFLIALYFEDDLRQRFLSFEWLQQWSFDWVFWGFWVFLISVIWCFFWLKTRTKRKAWRELVKHFGSKHPWDPLPKKGVGVASLAPGHRYAMVLTHVSSSGIFVDKGLTLVGRYQSICLPWRSISNIEVLKYRISNKPSYENARLVRLNIHELPYVDFQIPWRSEFEKSVPDFVGYQA